MLRKKRRKKEISGIESDMVTIHIVMLVSGDGLFLQKLPLEFILVGWYKLF